MIDSIFALRDVKIGGSVHFHIRRKRRKVNRWPAIIFYPPPKKKEIGERCPTFFLEYAEKMKQISPILLE